MTRHPATLVAIPATLLSLLACGGALDSLENNPEFNEAFEKSFMEEFPKACAKPLVDQGTDAAKAKEVCECAGQKLLDDTDLKELMTLMASPDSDDAAKVFGPVVEHCVKEVIGDGGGDDEGKGEKGKGKAKNGGGDDGGGEKGGKSKGGKSKGGKGKSR